MVVNKEKYDKKQSKQLEPVNHNTSNSLVQQQCSPVSLTNSKRNFPHKETNSSKRNLSFEKPSSRVSSVKKPYEPNDNLIPIVKKKRKEDKILEKATKPESYLSGYNYPWCVNDENTYHSGELSQNIKSLQTDKNSQIYPSHNVNSNFYGEERDYVKEYTKIVNPEQRKKYKDIYNRDYENYKELHDFIESYTKKFWELNNNLQKEKRGTEEYNRIKQQMIVEFEYSLDDKAFLPRKEKYDHLYKKLKHIKQLVKDYDNSPDS